ncbi:MAG: metallophosphoesterase [Oscillospiraceae bacterium]
MKKSSKIYLIIIILTLFLLCVFFIWQNNDIKTTAYTYINNQIPRSFENYKILQISDLHNKKFGNNQEYLSKIIKQQSPDIIVITGDLIDKRQPDTQPIKSLLISLENQYPIYYVTGNHENISSKSEELYKILKSHNVNILNNDVVKINKDTQSIYIMGLEDISFYSHDNISVENKLDNNIKSLKAQIDGFYFALSHRPEQMECYKKNEIPLIFTGHAHGGQVRFPFIGGLIAPNQGLFPKYDSGLFFEDNTTMILSRGLGNSLFPFRVFNQPEIVTVTLHCE